MLAGAAALGSLQAVLPNTPPLPTLRKQKEDGAASYYEHANVVWYPSPPFCFLATLLVSNTGKAGTCDPRLAISCCEGCPHTHITAVSFLVCIMCVTVMLGAFLTSTRRARHTQQCACSHISLVILYISVFIGVWQINYVVKVYFLEGS